VWLKIEASKVKADRRLDVFDVPEALGGFLHPLDRGVHGLHAGIGEPVQEIGQAVREGGAG